MGCLRRGDQFQDRLGVVEVQPHAYCAFMGQHFVPVTQKILVDGHAKGFPQLVAIGVGQHARIAEGQAGEGDDGLSDGGEVSSAVEDAGGHAAQHGDGAGQALGPQVGHLRVPALREAHHAFGFDEAFHQNGGAGGGCQRVVEAPKTWLRGGWIQVAVLLAQIGVLGDHRKIAEQVFRMGDATHLFPQCLMMRVRASGGSVER